MNKLKYFVLKHIYTIYRIFQYTPHGTLESLPLYKKIKLKIPTYDGSGQAVHPDILYGNESPHYVLTFTPYPVTNDKYENPCLLVSEDGLRFHEEFNGLNPLAPLPQTDHNDDPDIIYTNGIYSLVYLETRRPEKQHLHMLTSSDRQHWKDTVIHTEYMPLHGEKKLMVSPAQTHKSGLSYLFYILNHEKAKKPEHQIEYVIEDSSGKLNFEKTYTPFFDTLPVNPWHIDIFQDNDKWYMLITAVEQLSEKKRSYALYLATSTDLQSWIFCPKKILADCYRSTGFIRDGIMYIYYSENKPAILQAWQIGLYKIVLADFTKEEKK